MKVLLLAAITCNELNGQGCPVLYVSGPTAFATRQALIAT